MTKYKIVYYVQGEMEIEAEDSNTALSNFEDKVGFSEDDLYDNLNHNFVAISASKTN